MGKLIVTKVDLNGRQVLFRGLHNNSRFYKIGLDDCEETDKNVADKVGNIYVGYVRDIAKNINAAFIEYQKGRVGYFSISDNESPIFLNNKNSAKLCEGDLVLVQIQKEAVKTKALVLTSKISLTGRYVVLNVSKKGVGFSNKIKNSECKDNLHKLLSGILAEIEVETGETYGAVVRTNAANVDSESVKEELVRLVEKYRMMLKRAKTQARFTVILKEQEAYLKMISGAYKGEIEEIITDDTEIFEKIKTYVQENGPASYLEAIRLYEDGLLPLHKLYHIEGVLDEVRKSKVWLKSGAYLVIEPTEAMVVIDVNTGKCIRGKDLRKTILDVNMEAAKEIAYQLSLRNLSGIIMIDFISMDKEEDKEKLTEALKQLIRTDRIKTDFVEMTKLDLVELTRKKTEPPVYEQMLRIGMM